MVKRDLIINILLLLSLVTIGILFRLFVVKPYTIRPQDSNHYLKTGDYILVMKTQEPDYGDFVLYMVEGKSHIGRVVGKSGDSLTSLDDILYRNQEVVPQEFLEEDLAAYLQEENNELPFTTDFKLDQPIPQDNYYILKDQRRQMTDSRQFGLIPRSRIKGVLSFRLYPFNQFGFLPAQ